MIHNSGIGRTTVVKYEVTASIQVEGTAARRTQRTRRRQVNDFLPIESRAGDFATSVDGPAVQMTSDRHSTTSTTNETYAAVQISDCARRPRCGSMTAGYEISAMALPRLLAR